MIIGVLIIDAIVKSHLWNLNYWPIIGLGQIYGSICFILIDKSHQLSISEDLETLTTKLQVFISCFG